MKIISLIICLGLAALILGACMTSNSSFKVPDYEPIAHAISRRAAKKICKQFPQVRLIGQGGDGTMRPINVPFISY